MRWPARGIPAVGEACCLTSYHINQMVSHMKTTLNIDPGIMARLKAEAARRGTTMSALVEAGLRHLLERRAPAGQLPPLSVFHGGAELVDVADRNALYDALDGR